jgi:8-oxo-dGTP diphosphatase
MSFIRPFVGVALIVHRKGRDEILFGLRKGDHGPGTWSVPGGHLEHGEDPIDCARRELLEETGLVVGNVRVYEELPYVSTVFPNGRHYITLYFEADYYDQPDPVTLEPDKCERWEWRWVNDLPEPLFAALDAKKLGWR